MFEDLIVKFLAAVRDRKHKEQVFYYFPDILDMRLF